MVIDTPRRTFDVTTLYFPSLMNNEVVVCRRVRIISGYVTVIEPLYGMYFEGFKLIN